MKAMSPAMRWSLLMGALCAPVGIAVGLFIAATATGAGYGTFWAWAGLAAFVTAAGTWWLIVEWHARHTVLRGMMAGFLAGILAHPVTWYLVLVEANLCYWLTDGCRSSLNEPPMNLAQAFSGALVFSFWSLLLFGIVTGPGGLIIGGLLGRLRGKRVTSV
jgi:hypothetical protein